MRYVYIYESQEEIDAANIDLSKDWEEYHFAFWTPINVQEIHILRNRIDRNLIIGIPYTVYFTVMDDCYFKLSEKTRREEKRDSYREWLKHEAKLKELAKIGKARRALERDLLKKKVA
jgi:hypothetical protein